MKITNRDIRNRISKLNETYSCQLIGMGRSVINEKAMTTYDTDIIAESVKLSANAIVSENCDEIKEYDRILDLLETTCDRTMSVSAQVETVIRLLSETTDKVRKPEQVQSLLKRRLTKATVEKGAHKIDKKIDSADDLLKAAGTNLDKNLAKIKANLDKSKSLAKTTPGAKTESMEALEDCYKSLIEQCQKNIEVDRILRNYDRLSRRFNIDKVLHSIKEDFATNVDMYCGLLETWSDDEMSRKSKFNVAMETALYLNDKLYLNIDRSTIIESISDYYLFTDGSSFTTPLDALDRLYEYLKGNTMVSEAELTPFTDVYNRAHDIRPDNYGTVDYFVEESKKDLKKTKFIDDFKACAKKTPEELKKLVSKMYTESPENIFESIPNIFSIIRFFVVVGTFAIHPILGIVVFIVDRFIKLDLDRPHAAKMVAKFEKELDKVDKKIEKTTDDKKKERLKEYRKTVQEQVIKLKNYEDELYNDEQNAKREAEKNSKNASSEVDDFDFGLDEAVSLISMIESVMNRPADKFFDQVSANMSCLIKNGIIDDITAFALENHSMIPTDKLLDVYTEALGNLRSTEVKNYADIYSLNNNIQKLQRIPNENPNIDSINRIVGLYQLYEAMDMLDQERNSPYLLEVSFANTVNVVKTKVQDAFAKMSDGEKNLSKNIDITFVGFTKKVEDMFKSNNREAIIRGSIIPSASKMLKMALAAGLTAWLLHPIIAVIGILGYIGVSKSMQNKERQLILDEIDTELQMVDKYIQQAEAKDDMKALKNLLTTKKRLQREYTRIKYKVKMTTGSAPDVEKAVGPK